MSDPKLRIANQILSDFNDYDRISNYQYIRMSKMLMLRDNKAGLCIDERKRCISSLGLQLRNVSALVVSDGELFRILAAAVAKNAEIPMPIDESEALSLSSKKDVDRMRPRDGKSATRSSSGRRNFMHNPLLRSKQPVKTALDPCLQI